MLPLARPKNWLPILKRLNNNPLFIIGLFITLAAVGAIVFYLRFPNNYIEPNFYAEDGSIFYKTLHGLGFWRALITPFSGYAISGLYILEQVATALTTVFFNGEFVNMARSFSIISYAFLGATSAFAVILLRRIIRPWYILPFFYVSLLFVPMPGSDYAVIGTIGNLKFAFTFIALVCCIYRTNLPLNSKKIPLVDLVLLICAHTNVTTYLLLPFAALHFVPYIRKRSYGEIFRSVSFISLATLVALLIPQAVYAYFNTASPKGYLDTPYQWATTVEIFLGRTILFPMVASFIKNMNDLIVLCGSLATVVAGIILIRKNKTIFLFCLYAALITTTLFVVKRTGVSAVFTGYKDSGPDQFFYAQNWMILIGIFLTIGSLLNRLSFYSKIVCSSLIGIFLAFTYIPASGSFGGNNFMEKNVGNIYAAANLQCKTSASTLKLSSYPIAPFAYENLPRKVLCTKTTMGYYPKHISFMLTPYENRYIDGLGTKNHLKQTFISPQKNLAGISIYFSNFGQQVKSNYDLVLYDHTCHKQLQRIGLSEKKIIDNRYYLIPVKTIRGSSHREYCFEIVPSKGNPVQSPLAVQLSKPHIYEDGKAILNGVPLAEDVVFELEYK